MEAAGAQRPRRESSGICDIPDARFTALAGCERGRSDLVAVPISGRPVVIEFRLAPRWDSNRGQAAMPCWGLALTTGTLD